MKKLVVLVALMAFVVVVPLALAAEKPAAPAADKVNCCADKKCTQMTKADCDKAKGKVVKDCKECK